MSPQQIVALLVRCFCAWMLLAAVQMTLVTLFVARGAGAASMPSLAIAGLCAALAVAGWLGAGRLGRLLVGSAAQASAPLDTRGVGTVVCAAVGLLLVAFKGLAPAVAYATLLWALSATGQDQALRTPGNHIDGINGVAMLLLGAALVLLSRRFGRWLAR